ncbi:hypothetical protein BKA62DRAFT_680856 [Auriculariales sp. MPI-PUGE-AT-0066]|nr:hypothetical protein BKA62DRAFT_680856 [Auriculariales sp. MPI-PUGE-AT-0066]
MSYTLFHSNFSGSTAVLVALNELRVPHEVVEVDYDDVVARKDSESLRRILKANPLAQFPTLVTPDGTVMTEMTAILLFLVNQHGTGTPWDLAHLNTRQLATLYRFMVYTSGNIYPTVTHENFPERFIDIPAAHKDQEKDILEWIRNRGESRRGEAFELLERLVREFNEETFGEAGANTTFLLGTSAPTILDLMMAVVSHYACHPRPTWMKEKCPRLARSAKRTVAQSAFVELYRTNQCAVILDTK